MIIRSCTRGREAVVAWAPFLPPRDAEALTPRTWECDFFGNRVTHD